MSSDLIGAIDGASEFSAANYFLAPMEKMCDGQKIWDDANDSKLKGLFKDLEEPDQHIVLRSKNTGSWLTVRGATVTGILLLAMEFRGFLCTLQCYPPNLRKIKGCSQYLSIRHGLSFSHVVLADACQNKVCDNIL